MTLKIKVTKNFRKTFPIMYIFECLIDDERTFYLHFSNKKEKKNEENKRKSGVRKMPSSVFKMLKSNCGLMNERYYCLYLMFGIMLPVHDNVN